MKSPAGDLTLERTAERAHLIDLLDRFGAEHPEPGATHFSGVIGRYRLKWESHTEFVTYTIFEDGLSGVPFSGDAFSVFPSDWLAAAPGERITSALIHVELALKDDDIIPKAEQWFVAESLALSRVLDDALIVATDFRIDPAGHIRIAAFARPKVEQQRIGRVVQRLCEIETYKAMAMLGVMKARGLSAQMTDAEVKYGSLIADMAGEKSDPAHVLSQLLSVSGQVENMGAKSAYRFAATRAYQQIVNQRIEVLREDRFEGRQTIGEFMIRRFDPAMRTVQATERRLQEMSDRTLRAGELLRTQVDVERSAQNQAVLQSMDERAGLQLRLQKTVEGLSIVAVSYYAVNIALYLLGPVEKAYNIPKTILAAGITPIVLFSVWLTLRRAHKKFN
jgi:uncharacterized membrane-anchored protein